MRSIGLIAMGISGTLSSLLPATILTGCDRFPFGTSQQSNTVVMIHDAFQSLSFWDGFMQPPNWEGVILDTHIYQMFSDAVRLFLARGSHTLTFSRITTCRKHSTSRTPVPEALDYPPHLCGPSLVNGHLRPTTVPSILTAVALVPDTMVR
jgi:hypothetical protein